MKTFQMGMIQNQVEVDAGVVPGLIRAFNVANLKAGFSKEMVAQLNSMNKHRERAQDSSLPLQESLATVSLQVHGTVILRPIYERVTAAAAVEFLRQVRTVLRRSGVDQLAIDFSDVKAIEDTALGSLFLTLQQCGVAGLPLMIVVPARLEYKLSRLLPLPPIFVRTLPEAFHAFAVREVLERYRIGRARREEAEDV